MHVEPGRFLDTPAAPGDATLAGWLAEHARRPENRGALAHWQKIPARPPRHGDLAVPLPAPSERRTSPETRTRRPRRAMPPVTPFR